jgi:hypothetical protein
VRTVAVVDELVVDSVAQPFGLCLRYPPLRLWPDGDRRICRDVDFKH